MADELLPVLHNRLICAASLASRHVLPYAPESAFGVSAEKYDEGNQGPR